MGDDEERGDEFNSSNFLDVDWLSSSGSSFVEDNHGRLVISQKLSVSLEQNCHPPERGKQNSNAFPLDNIWPIT